jgi:uroporphyrinogen-III decarboxylase
MHLAAVLMDLDYSREYCQNSESLANAQIRCSEIFGIDHVNVSTDAFREVNAWGVEIDWSSHTPIPRSYINIDDFEALDPPELTSNPRIINRVNSVNLLSNALKGKNCIIGWIEAPFAEICCLFGLVNVLKLCKFQDWEKRIKILINRILPIQKEFALMQIEAGADIIGAGDSAISQIGPMRYEKCCLKATMELFKDIQKKVPVLYHICGDNSIIDKQGRDMLQLVSSTKAAVLDLDYQVDLKIAKNKIGMKNCIRGNTNTQLLGSSIYSINRIMLEIEKTITEGKPNGRFMYAAGCEWPWDPFPMACRNLGIAKTLVEKFGTY